MSAKATSATNMQTSKPTSQRQTPLPAIEWTDADREQLLWAAGVLSQVIVHGFRKAAADALIADGFRLATIRQDKEPFENLFKLSLYPLGSGNPPGRRVMKTLVLGVMAKIGCPLNTGDCHVDVAGRKVVASVVLPRSAWPAMNDG